MLELVEGKLTVSAKDQADHALAVEEISKLMAEVGRLDVLEGAVREAERAALGLTLSWRGRFEPSYWLFDQAGAKSVAREVLPAHVKIVTDEKEWNAYVPIGDRPFTAVPPWLKVISFQDAKQAACGLCDKPSPLILREERKNKVNYEFTVKTRFVYCCQYITCFE